MAETVLEMTTELIQAQIQTGQLPPNDMQEALRNTYINLMTLKTQEEKDGSPTTTTTTQTVDWRKSITRHSVTCLECGRSFKQLSGRHLRQHDLDSRSYRAKYGIPRTQPLSTRASTARRRELAQEIRPWEKAREVKVAKKGTRERVTRVGG